MALPLKHITPAATLIDNACPSTSSWLPRLHECLFFTTCVRPTVFTYMWLESYAAMTRCLLRRWQSYIDNLESTMPEDMSEIIHRFILQLASCHTFYDTYLKEMSKAHRQKSIDSIRKLLDAGVLACNQSLLAGIKNWPDAQRAWLLQVIAAGDHCSLVVVCSH